MKDEDGKQNKIKTFGRISGESCPDFTAPLDYETGSFGHSLKT